MKIGYARASAQDQNIKIQSDELKKYGCEKIIKEKVLDKNFERPELNKMIATLQKGDVVVVWKLDKIGKSLRNLIELITEFKNKGVAFVSLHDNINTATPNGKLIFNIFSSLADFEREAMRERTLVGLAAAKERGIIGGRKAGLSPAAMEKAKIAKKLFDKNTSAEAIAKQIGTSRATVYRYVEFIQNESDKKSENKKENLKKANKK